VIDAALRAFVRQRAAERCEYCLIHQEHAETAHHVEHIVARKHGGTDDAMNLALACSHCNLHKGANLTGIDPDSGAIVRLFHPRHDSWDSHFSCRGALIVGLTPTGRATVQVLGMNGAYRVDVRGELVAQGLYP
jgi:hypothetical protein